MQGLPVFAESVGSVPDVITDMQNGLLVSSDEQRVKAVELLVNDGNLRSRLGDVARQIAQDSFGIKQFTEAHEIAYKFALNEPN